MKCSSCSRSRICVFLLTVLGSLLLFRPGIALAATDEFFDVLKIGTHTYKNVTVTTRAKDYIFILHSGGMGNIKVAELSPDLKLQLGYGSAPKTKSAGAKAESWARQSAAGQALERGFRQAIDPKEASRQIQSLISPTLLIAVVGIGLIFYLFYCYCAMLICEKAGHPAGILVWLPLVQIIPMLRAAGMSPLWFVGFLVPFLNLIAHLVWSCKIVKARGKSGWVSLGLILPVTNILAFLYLAFSGASKARKTTIPHPQIMTLETA